MSNTNTVRNRITNNALKRKASFTTTQVASAVGASTRHTRRVLAELLEAGKMVTINNKYLSVVNTNSSARGF